MELIWARPYLVCASNVDPSEQCERMNVGERKQRLVCYLEIKPCVSLFVWVRKKDRQSRETSLLDVREASAGTYTLYIVFFNSKDTVKEVVNNCMRKSFLPGEKVCFCPFNRIMASVLQITQAYHFPRSSNRNLFFVSLCVLHLVPNKHF